MPDLTAQSFVFVNETAVENSVTEQLSFRLTAEPLLKDFRKLTVLLDAGKTAVDAFEKFLVALLDGNAQVFTGQSHRQCFHLAAAGSDNVVIVGRNVVEYGVNSAVAKFQLAL